MENAIEVLTSNGATGICVAMLFYMYHKDREVGRMMSEYNEIITNHFEREIEARKDETKSRLEIARAISKLAGDVANCPSNTMLLHSKKKH